MAAPFSARKTQIDVRSRDATFTQVIAFINTSQDAVRVADFGSESNWQEEKEE